MGKSFKTQPAFFVSATALDHPSLHGLDDTEAVLDWNHLEALMNEIGPSELSASDATALIVAGYLV
jgi:hypothetical protein